MGRDGLSPRVAVVLGVLVSAGCVTTPRGTEPACNDTDSCRRLQAEQEAAFARAVAAEPASERLAVLVTTSVFVDRPRGLVYALRVGEGIPPGLSELVEDGPTAEATVRLAGPLDSRLPAPSLVALDLQTGALRWKASSAAGDRLWRAGRWLVVGQESGKFPARVAFVNPDQPERATVCTLALGAPSVAENVAIDPFDRAGRPLVAWSSSWSYRGGTPPGPRELQRQRDAQACGVLELDPTTCVATPRALRDFTSPPTDGCSSDSALLVLPAARASALAVMYAGEPVLSVKTEEATPGPCARVATLTLEARSAAGALLWTHPLGQRTSPTCAPP